MGKETVTRAVVREGGREGGKEGEREETVVPSYKCISYFPPASTSYPASYPHMSFNHIKSYFGQHQAPSLGVMVQIDYLDLLSPQVWPPPLESPRRVFFKT